jgi:hypothetical protein
LLIKIRLGRVPQGIGHFFDPPQFIKRLGDVVPVGIGDLTVASTAAGAAPTPAADLPAVPVSPGNKGQVLYLDYSSFFTILLMVA